MIYKQMRRNGGSLTGVPTNLILRHQVCNIMLRHDFKVGKGKKKKEQIQVLVDNGWLIEAP